MKFDVDEKKVSDLHEVRDLLDFNPAWQRGAVWGRDRKSLLIDSILRDFAVPELYFRVLPAQGSIFDFEVVDGQQRLLAIMDYIDGEYELNSKLNKVGNSVLAGKRYNELSPPMRKKLDNYTLRIVVLKRTSLNDVSQFFSRMQMGIQLVPAEKRNAIQSGIRHSIDSTARNNNFFKNSRIPMARYKHQDYLAHVFTLIRNPNLRDIKAPRLNDVYQEIIILEKSDLKLLKKIHECLLFLDKVNSCCSNKIVQKWIFVDFVCWLYRRHGTLKKMKPDYVAKKYMRFHNLRRKFTGQPQQLLTGRQSTENRLLYNYIENFSKSGAVVKNIEIRTKSFEHFLR